jgi:excisionase family DNA binding protein
MGDAFIDTYEAAEDLQVSRPTLYRLLEQFAIKKYKVPGNRRTLIRREDLDRLRQPQEREGKAAA